MQVKKNKHDTLRLHGAGKHLGKGEASRVLRHLVVEEILVEHVKKSDYGSVSSVLKVKFVLSFCLSFLFFQSTGMSTSLLWYLICLYFVGK